MLISKNKTQYLNVAFDNEDELEQVVLQNAELLFGDMSVVLPKKKISTLDGVGTIPDGVVVDLRKKQWLILELSLRTMEPGTTLRLKFPSSLQQCLIQ